MPKNLLLVDFENRQKVDLSLLDESFEAIIFVGSLQKQPKLNGQTEHSNKFRRIDFQKIEGNGKNALDFHIAFQLGRVFETARDTACFILSGDKGFDPLLQYLNKSGLKCQRIDSMEELAPTVAQPAKAPVHAIPPLPTDSTVCRKCKKASTIEHNGGRWCTNCGSFATPPDPRIIAQIKTRQNYQPRQRLDIFKGTTGHSQGAACLHCNYPIPLGAILCGACDD